MDLSIIIVNYNTKSITSNCIESVFKYTKDLDFEIILVDNNSKDGSRVFFEQDKRIVYLYQNENYGFGIANNIGADVAKGDFLFFLNSDTLLNENSCVKLIDIIKNDSSIGVAGPILVDEHGIDNGSFYYLETGDLIEKIWHSLAYNYLYKKDMVRLTKRGVLDVGFVCGASMMMKKELFDEIDGFDSNFFMYAEEMDLQMRIKKKGLRRVTTNITTITHLRGGKKEQVLQASKFQICRNSLYVYARKHIKGVKFFMFRLLSFFGMLSYLLSAKAKSFTKEEKYKIFKDEISAYKYYTR